MRRRRGIGGARILRPARRFRRAALPVAGTRERGRVDAAGADSRKMLSGNRGVGEKTQCNPAGREFLLGLVDVARGQRAVTRDQVSGATFADVEHLARQQSPFDPPFVDVMQARRILWRAEHQLGCLGEFLFATEQLDLAEDIAGVGVKFARDCVQQRSCVGRLAISRNARLGQRHLTGIQPLRGAKCSLMLAAVKKQIHPSLLVARRQQPTEHLKRRAFGVLGHDIVAPAIAHQPLRVGSIASRQHHPRQDELPFGR